MKDPSESCQQPKHHTAKKLAERSCGDPKKIPSLAVSLARYLTVSVVAYTYLLAMLFLLVDVCGVAKVPAYMLAYSSSYILDYTSTLRFVFHGDHEWSKLLKFGVYIIGSLLLGTILFVCLIRAGIHHLIAPVLASFALMPVRYVVNRFWVYR